MRDAAIERFSYFFFLKEAPPEIAHRRQTCLAPPQSFIIAGWRVLLSQKLSKYLGYITEIIWAFKSQECVCFSPPPLQFLMATMLTPPDG